MFKKTKIEDSKHRVQEQHEEDRKQVSIHKRSNSNYRLQLYNKNSEYQQSIAQLNI